MINRENLIKLGKREVTHHIWTCLDIDSCLNSALQELSLIPAASAGAGGEITCKIKEQKQKTKLQIKISLRNWWYY